MKIIRDMELVRESTHEPLSKIKGRGVETLSMNSGDHHSAWFFDGLLCGFTWFGKTYICNRWREIQKDYKVVHAEDTVFVPERDRAAALFEKLYGAEGRALLDRALAAAGGAS